MTDLLIVTFSASVPVETRRMVPVVVAVSLIAAWIEEKDALSLVRVTVTAGTRRSSRYSRRRGTGVRGLEDRRPLVRIGNERFWKRDR
jgi:hypothetical protein